MHTVNIQLPNGRSSHIHIGSQITDVQKYISNCRAVIITEAVIYELYKQQFPVGVPVVHINGGEGNKTLRTIEQITKQFIELGIDRNTLVIGIGGGIVCDIAGFMASTYMRGLRMGFVATTLLAQVDAAVGGKNGVNVDKYKNMLGVFNQPDFVICATHTLQTLPSRELCAGLAEVVKAAIITDENLLTYLEANTDNAISLNPTTINHIVKRCIEIKADIVQRDEHDTGERSKLNLGHTFGHAIEKHSTLLHGEAVSIGIVIAARISQKLNLISATDVSRITNLLTRFNLPVQTNIANNLLFDALSKDKKKHNDTIRFVLINAIGSTTVQQLTFSELQKLYTSL